MSSTEEPIAPAKIPEVASDAAPAAAGDQSGAQVAKPKKAKAKKADATKKTRTRSTMSHPPYFDMISEAISTLKERNGSSQYAVQKFIEEKNKNLPTQFRKLLLVNLKKFVASDRLVKVKGSYKLPSVRSSRAKLEPAAKPKAAATSRSKSAVAKPKATAKPKAAAAKPKAKPAAAKAKVVAAKPKTKPAAAKTKVAAAPVAKAKATKRKALIDIKTTEKVKPAKVAKTNAKSTPSKKASQAAKVAPVKKVAAKVTPVKKAAVKPKSVKSTPKRTMPKRGKK